MNSPRLNRLFRSDGRCVVLAFDHGFFGEPSWLAGLEDMSGVIAMLAAVQPDGIALPTGSARHLQAIVGAKPALIVRGDVTNAYLARRPPLLYAHALEDIVERAVALDAACVECALMTYPGHEELSADCIATIDVLRARCNAVAMPLLVEVMALRDNDGVPQVHTAFDDIAPLVRQAMELGADILKVDPCEPVADFARLVELAAGLLILASGGATASETEVLERTADLMAAGASGILYGRNVMWAQKPALMTEALLEVVHGGASAEEAATILMR